MEIVSSVRNKHLKKYQAAEITARNNRKKKL